MFDDIGKHFVTYLIHIVADRMRGPQTELHVRQPGTRQNVLFQLVRHRQGDQLHVRLRQRVAQVRQEG